MPVVAILTTDLRYQGAYDPAIRWSYDGSEQVRAEVRLPMPPNSPAPERISQNRIGHGGYYDENR
jgi:hypothetical protein